MQWLLIDNHFTDTTLFPWLAYKSIVGPWGLFGSDNLALYISRTALATNLFFHYLKASEKLRTLLEGFYPRFHGSRANFCRGGDVPLMVAKNKMARK